MIKYKISKKELKPNDVIVLTFDIKDSLIDLEEARDIYNSIKKQFPEHEVTGFVKGIDLDFQDWESVYNYVMSIKPKEKKY